MWTANLVRIRNKESAVAQIRFDGADVRRPVTMERGRMPYNGDILTKTRQVFRRESLRERHARAKARVSDAPTTSEQAFYISGGEVA